MPPSQAVGGENTRHLIVQRLRGSEFPLWARLPGPKDEERPLGLPVSVPRAMCSASCARSGVCSLSGASVGPGKKLLSLILISYPEEPQGFADQPYKSWRRTAKTNTKYPVSMKWQEHLTLFVKLLRMISLSRML